MWNSKSLSALKDRYYSLARRERLALGLGLVALIAILLVQAVFLPIRDRLTRLESTVKAKESDLSELRTIVAQFRRLETGIDATRKGEGEGFNLFSIAEKLASKNGLMDKVDYMKPGSLQLDAGREEKWVEVKLSRITLKAFTGYLYDLQSVGKGVYVKRLSVRKEGEFLNVILQPAVVEAR